MTERRKAVLLRNYVEGLLWMVEADHITPDEATRELISEGINAARVKELIADAQTRRLDAD